jgi:phosphoribosylaminoimidazolecarboxamide formyltransferase/IMP cyclohydrolase
MILQDADMVDESAIVFETKTELAPTDTQLNDLKYANICAKHLKSNTIVLVKDYQLLGMGCGQTSRIDACQSAITKAKLFGFSLEGAVMASDAFFPFPDCVELAANEGIVAVVQPGGSIKDQLSIDFCNERGITMVFTGFRHFKH